MGDPEVAMSAAILVQPPTFGSRAESQACTSARMFGGKQEVLDRLARRQYISACGLPRRAIVLATFTRRMR